MLKAAPRIKNIAPFVNPSASTEVQTDLNAMSATLINCWFSGNVFLGKAHTEADSWLVILLVSFVSLIQLLMI